MINMIIMHKRREILLIFSRTLIERVLVRDGFAIEDPAVEDNPVVWGGCIEGDGGGCDGPIVCDGGGCEGPIEGDGGGCEGPIVCDGGGCEGPIEGDGGGCDGGGCDDDTICVATSDQPITKKAQEKKTKSPAFILIVTGEFESTLLHACVLFIHGCLCGSSRR